MNRKTTYENVKETYFLHPRLTIAINLLFKIHEAETLSLQVAANEMGWSISYIEQIARVMREHDLIASQRGPGGGAYAIVSLKKITIAQLLDMFIPSPDDFYEAKLFAYAKRTCGKITLDKLKNSPI